MGAFVGLDRALKDFSSAIAGVERQLADLKSRSGTPPSSRALEAAAKSALYIWLAAALETFTSALLRAVLQEIENSGCRLDLLHYRLFSIACAAELQSLQDIRGLKMWARRAEILERVGDPAPVTFGNQLLPLDGTTIRPHHLETIFRVFGFAGPVLPAGPHQFALIDLAETRNRLAHGEDDPVTVGRSKAISDVEGLAKRVEEIGLHLLLAAEEFLAAKRYTR